MNIQVLYPKLIAIENEIKSIKLLISHQQKSKKIVSLRGMLKGVEIKEEDFSEAKKSLFNIS